MLSMLLWDFWSAGQPNRAAAVGAWLIVALGVMVGAWQALQRRETLASRGGPDGAYQVGGDVVGWTTSTTTYASYANDDGTQDFDTCRQMVRDARTGDPCLGSVQPSGGEDLAEPPVHAVGGLGRITELKEFSDGRFLVNLQGVTRFRIEAELPREGKLYRRVNAAQTPHEYQRVLALWLPEAGADFAFITNHCVLVRYGDCLPSHGTLDQVRTTWEKLRQAKPRLPGKT